MDKMQIKAYDAVLSLHIKMFVISAFAKNAEKNKYWLYQINIIKRVYLVSIIFFFYFYCIQTNVKRIP